MMPGEVGAPGGELGRQLRATRRVLALMDRLVAERGVERIARLVSKSVPRFGAMHGEGVVLDRAATAIGGSNEELPRSLLAALSAIESCAGGPIALDGRAWAWAFPLLGPS